MKIMTNFDKIKGMDSDELAEFLCQVSSYASEYRCEECIATEYCRQGHNGFIDWLKAENWCEYKEY